MAGEKNRRRMMKVSEFDSRKKWSFLTVSNRKKGMRKSKLMSIVEDLDLRLGH